MFIKIFTLVILISSAAGAQGQCEGLFSDRAVERRTLLDLSLRELMIKEAAEKTAEEIAAMNAKSIAEIEAEIPQKVSVKKSSITMATAEFLRNQIYENPIVRPMNDKYSQPGTSIGYCFGRATFVHLMLLKMGVQKSSIQKIWAVGEMKAGDILWQFHVATMAFTESHGWVVIDSNHMHPIPVREWTAHYSKQTETGRIRFYATDAGKFSFELGKYSRVQLGLDLPAERDWYKNYFKDMFNWLKSKKVTEDSVKTINAKLSNEEKTLNSSFADMWRSMVEFFR